MANSDQDGTSPNIRVLKIVVIVLGLLIVLGVGVIISTVILRIGRMSSEPVQKKLELPQGAEIIDMVPAADRFAFRLKMPDGSQRIIVVDPKSLDTAGRLDILPGK